MSINSNTEVLILSSDVVRILTGHTLKHEVMKDMVDFLVATKRNGFAKDLASRALIDIQLIAKPH